MKPRLICFAGRASSGKSTAARYVCERLLANPSYWCNTYSFAAPLKAWAIEQYDFTDQQVYGTQASKEAIDPRYGISPREAMQRLGYLARKHIWPEIWVDKCFDSINRDLVYIKEKQPIVTIEDLRYPNEAELVYNNTNFDAKIVKLICTDASLSSEKYSNHDSETGVDEIPAKYIYSTITSHRSDNSLDLKQKLDDLLVDLGLLIP